MTWSLSGLDLGIIRKESGDLDTGLMVIGIPGVPASNGIALGISGLELSLSVSGVNTFTSKLNAQKFLYSGSAGTGTMAAPASDSFLGIIGSSANAADMQTTSITYSSDFFASVSGKVQNQHFDLIDGAAYSYVSFSFDFLVIS